MERKVVYITGGSSGIGTAMVHAFSDAGWDVAFSYLRSEEAAGKISADIEAKGRTVLAIRADAASEADTEAAFSAIGKKFGHLDLLINNAGAMVKRCSIADMDLELFRTVMDVNFTSAFLNSRRAIPLLADRAGASIINFSSIAEHSGGGQGAAIYSASKAAVHAFSKGLAKELAPRGVRVNVIAPGFIDTRFHEITPKEVRLNNPKVIPLGREGLAGEIASVALFLASPAASYITGEMIEVNGGLNLD